jgi:hypothetical protein
MGGQEPDDSEEHVSGILAKMVRIPGDQRFHAHRKTCSAYSRHFCGPPVARLASWCCYSDGLALSL